jgi:glutamate synthase (NADPH/NADH) small chain
MDCGIPFCHTGCPLGNIIPDWNDLVYRDRWREAIDKLHATNNFPEFTGWVCPAPCESACVLGINDDPVTIKQIELSIIERAWAEGWVQPLISPHKTGKTVAIVGSGPAGLAAAQQLARAGHSVTVFERADQPGGLLMYGIPDFKLEKWIVRRRLEQMEAEGVIFKTGVEIGKDISAETLASEYDALILTGGATRPRDLNVPGRELEGTYFAMQFLPQQNKRIHDPRWIPAAPLSAEGKHVVIIGGGDTGSDCLGTSLRQGAKSVTQFELMPMPPKERAENNPWPQWPMILRTSSSHEEGLAAGRLTREWAVNTKLLIGSNGKVEKLKAVRLDWDFSGPRPSFTEIEGSEFEIPADLVLLAMGFAGPEETVPGQLGLELDARGNVKTDECYRTTRPGVYAAGDMRRGQSLVVWAIAEGRASARAVDQDLMGATTLAPVGAVVA